MYVKFCSRELKQICLCHGCMALSEGTELKVATKTKTKILYWKNTIITGRPSQ